MFKENKRFEELNNEDYDDGVYLRQTQSHASSHVRNEMAGRNKQVKTEDLELDNIPE